MSAFSQLMNKSNHRRPGRPKGAKDLQPRKKGVSLACRSSDISILEMDTKKDHHLQILHVPGQNFIRKDQEELSQTTNDHYPKAFADISNFSLHAGQNCSMATRDVASTSGFTDPFHDDWPFWEMAGRHERDRHFYLDCALRS